MAWYHYLPIVGPIEAVKDYARGEASGRDLGAGLYGVLDPLGGMAMGAMNAQLDAAEAGAARAQEAGQQGASEIERAGLEADLYSRQGESASIADYQRAIANAQAQQAGLRPMFQGEMDAGNTALLRMQQAASGDMSQIYLDPAYQLRQEEMQRGLDRQASASGMYGSGSHLRNTMRAQQDLASQEYNSAIQRLMGIAANGQQATNTYVGLNQQAAGNALSGYGAIADTYSRGGQFRSNLAQNTGAAYANALNNAASNVNNFNIQRSNAVAQGAANLNNNFQNAGNTALQMYMANQNRGQ